MRTLIARAQRATPTLLLVEDMHGAQFGVYCTGVWQSEPFQFDDDFSGSAEMFVFHVANRAERVFVLDDDDDDDDSSSVFSGYSSSNTEDDIKNYVSEIRVVPRAVCCRATRANHYYQLISSSAGGVSFGCNSVDSQRGGGGSALTLSHDLLSGHSEPSDTYGNPCLSTHETFETRLLELWSLSSH